MATTESLRYQQRCEFLEKKLQASQENLKDEKTQEQIDVETAAKHAEVMEKVEKLNELTQANKVLTDEIKSLEQRNKILDTKVVYCQFMVFHIINHIILSHFIGKKKCI